MKQKKTVDAWLNEVDFSDDPGYVPSEFALEFVNFIKLVNGGKGEENKTPVMHYKMLDGVAGNKKNIADMVFRGGAKTSVLCEYMILYLAVHGGLPGFGKVNFILYVSDSMENGVKNMRRNLEFRRENSDFLMEFLPKIKFTDARWEFFSKFGGRFVVSGHGARTGVRGKKEYGERPTMALLDDLISDEDAKSPTMIENINNVVSKAVNYALHTHRRKIIWTGTPFNAKDPLYCAVESGAWHVNVYPVCEEFPCKREDFRGAWPDRFDYDFVLYQYETAKAEGKLDSFNQELMLRIMSDEERLIQESDLSWYKHANVRNNRGAFNFYITTDFATSEEQSADFSVLSVWALNNNGDWFWVDGVCKKMLMDDSIDHLFRLGQKWNPQSVGIEVSGQQGGFIRWIMGEMQTRNIYFSIASAIGSKKPGLRPTKDKMSRFQLNAVPLFKMGKIFFPEELRDAEELREILNELRLATIKGFKSKNDDCIDTITQLGEIQTWKPSQESDFGEQEETVNAGGIWGGHHIKDEDGDSSYFV